MMNANLFWLCASVLLPGHRCQEIPGTGVLPYGQSANPNGGQLLLAQASQQLSPTTTGAPQLTTMYLKMPGSTTPHEGQCIGKDCFENDSSYSGRSPSGFGDSGSGDSGSGDSGSSGSAMMLWQWAILICCGGTCCVIAFGFFGVMQGLKQRTQMQKKRARGVKQVEPEITPTPPPAPMDSAPQVSESPQQPMTEPPSQPSTVQMPLPTVSTVIPQYSTVQQTSMPYTMSQAAPQYVTGPSTTSTYYSSAAPLPTYPAYTSSVGGAMAAPMMAAPAAYPMTMAAPMAAPTMTMAAAPPGATV